MSLSFKEPVDALQPLECDFKGCNIADWTILTRSMNIYMYYRLADSSQTIKIFSSVGELSSKLICDNFYANFETLWLFSIRYNECDIDKWDFFYQVF